MFYPKMSGCGLMPVRIALLSVFLFLVAPLAAAPFNPIFEYSSGTPSSAASPYTLGFAFTTSSAFTIDALAYWDDGMGNDHEVGIWSTAGTLLVSTTVLGTDPLMGHYRYGAISDYALAPGTYVIGGEAASFDAVPISLMGVTTLAGYSWVEDRQVVGAGLNFPTLAVGGYGDNAFAAVNFSVAVPEPGTGALLLAGVVVIGLRRKLRSNPGTVTRSCLSATVEGD